MVLVDKVLGDMGKGPLDLVNEQEFRSVVCEIFLRIYILLSCCAGMSAQREKAGAEIMQFCTNVS